MTLGTEELPDFMTWDELPMFDVEPIRVRGRFGEIGNVRRWRQSDTNDMWRTPRELFDGIAAELGPFTLDVACTAESALCERFFTPDDDGLEQPWAPDTCWMNPPYSDLEAWTTKAAFEAAKGATVVGLLPVRTDLGWFHQNVIGTRAEIRFIRGRVRFWNDSSRLNAPFPSMVVVWRPTSASECAFPNCDCEGESPVCPDYRDPDLHRPPCTTIDLDERTA